MSDMFMLLQKLPFDGKRQIRLSTLSKLTPGNAFRLEVPKSFKFSLLPTDSVILDHVVHVIHCCFHL
jgi:hypothetical protein